ncbi:MAG: type II toxin-antitoxin system HicA family toxin [Anaerolineae bacterium]|nr:type II toxin-antitoxin system HicA family toxin [Anaerolineae bacterium]
MPKLPVISGRECINALEKVGFNISHQKGSHVRLRRDEPKISVSVPNHKTLIPGTLRAIIRQAELTVEEFLELL